MNTIGKRDLVAVFDESGASSAPGEDPSDDFALAAVVFAGRRAMTDLLHLDATLQHLTGQPDYKYRQVRQVAAARKAVVDCLNHQSGLIRVFGYYAAGGAFVEQARRELHAVQQFGGDIAVEEENLQRMLADPRREGLSDAVRTSVPAMSAWAASRSRAIKVYFDDRTDLARISTEVVSATDVYSAAAIWSDAYKWMDWCGACPESLASVARVADIFAGDIRATFKTHGEVVWRLIQQHGFVGRHEAVASSPSSLWAGPIPAPKVGVISHSIWDQNWTTGSTATTMFHGYRSYVLSRRLSLYSPCGRGCILFSTNTGFDVHQVMD